MTAPALDARSRLRRITGLTPSGHLHVGNLLGAMAPIAAGQYDHDTVVFLADLHAMTVRHDPARVRANTLEQATLLLAAGVDPEVTLLYPQSQVPAHTELHYLLECVTGVGEAQRMIQYREKSARQRQVRLSLLTYPVLMAADILLHRIREVPVGDDQDQHVELARDLAIRFNQRYGDTFPVPVAVHPSAAARVMDLADPTSKMSKSAGSGAGTLFLLDPPDVLRRKVLRAVTDSGTTVAYDPVHRPGVANLLEILAACAGRSPADLATEFDSYGRLKAAVVDAVLARVTPIQARYAELSRDPAHVHGLLRAGAERARAATADTVRAARAAIGLLD
ncbi:tryptophan--tRNA ligase [Plantactinospora sp. KBS50]|uniref:tryptophan--tRNA ligase n=1 Tax=Plantactinospora sp. KBS50 TaxID=2024580 RepID=UPI000BAABB2B|nr:tryptophan--tRNA ligase [Plantactinospora sp. KBS50]ASW56276.1 tryptophan--tRNA ligase [Plantactinospora sp. KBS50]